MAKRKIDCTLNEVIFEYLKKRRFEKSLKLFGQNYCPAKNDQTRPLEEFCDYLKKKEIEKESMNHDDLGFEINFGAFQPQMKVSST